MIKSDPRSIAKTKKMFNFVVKLKKMITEQVKKVT